MSHKPIKLLIIFAAWAKDWSENSQRWMNWYREIFDREFCLEDKFISIGFDACKEIEERYKDMPNIIGMERVDGKMHVNSDASQYQLGIKRCWSRLDDYDYVFMMHMKGASYNFADFDPWRAAVEQTIFNKLTLETYMKSNPRLLIAERGHMIQAGASVAECGKFANTIGITGPAFNFAAGTTIYAVPAQDLKDLFRILPPAYGSKNLLSLGESRFFFEAKFPSLLAMRGVEPVFVGGARFNPDLSQEVSYDIDSQHNSALVLREFNRRREQGGNYKPLPIPYIFGEIKNLKLINIEFSV